MAGISKTLLVTGVAGFIGSNFVSYYLGKNTSHNIIGLDKLTYSGSISNFNDYSDEISKRFTFIKGDINNYELVDYLFTKYDIDYIINFAAESHVDRSIEDPLIFFKSNILGVANILEIIKKHWYKNGSWVSDKRYLQISTDEVYGALGSEGLFTENTPLDPHSPYSASKASADLLVKSYFDTYKLPVVITRCSNNYGIKQYPEKLIPIIIKNALNGDRIPIYGDGMQIRDWLHVLDHCAAIEMALMRGVDGEVYNIGGSNEINNLTLTKIILDELNQITDNQQINYDLISFVKDRLGHDRRYGVDSSKIQKELGWKPVIGFEEGLKEAILWYYNNREKI